MHPILFEIPLSWTMVVVVGFLFGIGAIIRRRYAPADRDASYLATFLGLNVQWGVVVAPWPLALLQGILTGGLAVALATAVKIVAAGEAEIGWATVGAVAAAFAVGGVLRYRFDPAIRQVSEMTQSVAAQLKWDLNAGLGRGVALHALLVGGAGAAGAGVLKVLLDRKTFSFHATSIPLHIYGLMMASAFIVGIWLAMAEAKHERLPNVAYLDAKGKPMFDKNGKPLYMSAQDLVSDLSFYLLISGLGGARALYIFTRWKDDYAPDPWRILMFWQGGLVWYGGLIGATLTAVWFVRKNKVAFLPYGDTLVPGVSLAHAVGRLGCFAAGCCFGNVAKPGFPLAVQFPADSPAAAEHLAKHLIHSDLDPSLAVYPTQIMEALGEVVIFFILLKLRTRKRFHGQILLIYFGLYAILRTFMEMVRGDPIRGFFFKWPTEQDPLLLSTSQGVSLVTATVAIVLTVVLVRQRARATAHHLAPGAA